MPDSHISNDAVVKATGKAWDEWFTVMDTWGANQKSHKEIAAWLDPQIGGSGWWSQMITGQYERARGLREMNERANGYGIEIQRTIKTTLDEVWNAWADPAVLSQWFTSNAKQDFREGGRYSNSDKDAGEFKRIVHHKLIRFTWEQPQHKPGSMVEVAFKQVYHGKVVVSLQHEQLSTKKDADDLKVGWAWAMDSLKSFLETGKKIMWDEWKKSRKLKVES